MGNLYENNFEKQSKEIEEGEYKEDLRVVRTRVLLCRALFELLETIPYEKITVQDICNKALVHRATFYNHFEDKNKLLEYAIDEIKENLFESTIEKETYSDPKEMYMNLISKVLDFTKENQKQLLLILNNNSYEKAYMLLLTTIKRSIRYLTSKNQYKQNFALPNKVLIDFLSGGITNLGIEWIRSSNPCSKEEMLKYFDLLLNDKVYLNKS